MCSIIAFTQMSRLRSLVYFHGFPASSLTVSLMVISGNVFKPVLKHMYWTQPCSVKASFNTFLFLLYDTVTYPMWSYFKDFLSFAPVVPDCPCLSLLPLESSPHPCYLFGFGFFYDFGLYHSHSDLPSNPADPFLDVWDLWSWRSRKFLVFYSCPLLSLIGDF